MAPLPRMGSPPSLPMRCLRLFQTQMPPPGKDPLSSPVTHVHKQHPCVLLTRETGKFEPLPLHTAKVLLQNCSNTRRLRCCHLSGHLAGWLAGCHQGHSKCWT